MPRDLLFIRTQMGRTLHAVLDLGRVAVSALGFAVAGSAGTWVIGEARLACVLQLVWSRF